MTDTPEITRLESVAVRPDDHSVTRFEPFVSLADAIQAVRDTEARRTREIVEALRAADDGGDGYGSGDWAAVLIERTFLSPDNPEGHPLRIMVAPADRFGDNPEGNEPRFATQGFYDDRP